MSLVTDQPDPPTKWVLETRLNDTGHWPGHVSVYLRPSDTYNFAGRRAINEWRKIGVQRARVRVTIEVLDG